MNFSFLLQAYQRNIPKSSQVMEESDSESGESSTTPLMELNELG
jgi:hypothetical protein